MNKKAVLRVVGLALVLPVLAGCAAFSDNARVSMLAGDADLTLFQSRTAKNVSKVMDSTNSTNAGTATSAPTGGGTITLDPSQLAGLIRAVQAPSAAAPREVAPIPPPEPVVRKTPIEVRTHMVEEGDTLWDIANEHGTTVERLQKRNGIRGSLIHPGQVLVIP